MKKLDVQDLRASEFHQHMLRIVVPRPIAWVSTCSADAVSNIAPFSYFTAVGSRPPSLLFCPANRRDGSPKDTMANIEQTGEFVVNVVTDELAERMNLTSAELSPAESEFELAKLETAESVRVSVPRVAESPVQMECRLRELIRVGDGPGGANIVLGEVVFLHMDPSVLDDQGLVDPELLNAVGRMGETGYCRTRDRFDLQRPQ